ncbi:MAG: DNA-formamidopyrimidine glycosylase family protein [Actinomycetota bacterium]
MYELPEIETVRRDLDKEISGKKVKTVEVMANSVIPKSRTRKDFAGLLEGAKLGSVKRRGMYLVTELPEDQLLVIQPGAGTLLRRAATKDGAIDGTVAVVTFTQGGQLRVVDPDGNGALSVIAAETFDEEHPEVAELGLDPVEEPISWVDFGRRVLPRTEKLKVLLTDPAFVVGIGAIYSDEILHHALLRGDRQANSLTSQEVRRLYRALVETVHNGIKYRGTSVDGYLDVFGEPGGYDEYLEVYGRAGERSRNGRGEVMKQKISGMVHYFSDYQV